MEHQKDVRRFYGFKDLQPIGFVHFDPIYQQGKVIGYVPNISRANHLFKQGLFYAIMAVALEQFKQEGVRIVNLGLSPLHLKASLAQSRQPQNKQSQNKQPQNELSHRDQTPGLRPSKVLTRTFQLTQQYGRQFYNFQGIQFTKQRFKGEEHPSYVASRQRLPWKAFLACFRLSNLI
jgi:phosphatidylglycerol lysyltransferase